jgi:adenylate kinase
MRKYVILGPQGSGKGTQAKFLAKDFDLVHISVGDILRWHIQSRTKLGARVTRIVASGRLVPDALVDEVVRERLELHDWNYGFVLDGFPRNEAQALFFLERYDVDAAILLDVSDAVAMDRILARRLCSGCGLDYNLIFHRPAQSGVCDVCGAPLLARPDDGVAVVRDRLADYRLKARAILEVFRRKEQVITVDGARAVAEVQNEIRAKLRLTNESEAA